MINRITATTHEDRSRAVSKLEEAIQNSACRLTDFRFYADLLLNAKIEVNPKYLSALRENLSRTGFSFEDDFTETLDRIDSPSDQSSHLWINLSFLPKKMTVQHAEMYSV